MEWPCCAAAERWGGRAVRVARVVRVMRVMGVVAGVRAVRGACGALTPQQQKKPCSTPLLSVLHCWQTRSAASRRWWQIGCSCARGSASLRSSPCSRSARRSAAGISHNVCQLGASVENNIHPTKRTEKNSLKSDHSTFAQLVMVMSAHDCQTCAELSQSQRKPSTHSPGASDAGTRSWS